MRRRSRLERDVVEKRCGTVLILHQLSSSSSLRCSHSRRRLRQTRTQATGNTSLDLLRHHVFPMATCTLSETSPESSISASKSLHLPFSVMCFLLSTQTHNKKAETSLPLGDVPCTSCGGREVLRCYRARRQLQRQTLEKSEMHFVESHPNMLRASSHK